MIIMNTEIIGLAKEIYEGIQKGEPKINFKDNNKDVIKFLYDNDNAVNYFKELFDSYGIRRKLEQCNKIILYGDDIYGIIYGLYAYALYYADWKIFPDLRIIVPSNEISRDIAGFLRRLEIPYQLYTEEQKYLLARDILSVRNFFVYAPERQKDIQKFGYKNLLCYMYKEEFSNIFNSGCVSQKGMMTLLNEYVSGCIQRQTRHQRFRDYYPNLQKKTAEKWKSEYDETEFSEEVNKEAREELLSKHEFKIKDILITCRNH